MIEVIGMNAECLCSLLNSCKKGTGITLWFTGIAFFTGTIEELRRNLSGGGSNLYISDIRVEHDRINAELIFPTGSDIPFIIGSIISKKEALA